MTAGPFLCLDFCQFTAKTRKIIVNDFPDKLKIYALVVMDDSIAQSINVPPGNRWVCICKDTVNPVCQLTHLTEVKYASLHQFCIVAELCITDAIAIT